MIENIRGYANFWVREQLCTTPDKDIFNRFASSSTKEMNLAQREDSFRKYVSDVLGRASDCYVAKAEESGEVEPLGKPAVVISDEEKGRELM